MDSGVADRREQRRSRRRATQARCWLGDGEVERYAHLGDVSLGGARIVTIAPPPVGREVRLVFSLEPKGPEVTVQARVVWRAEGTHGRGGMMGVCFLDLSSSVPITDYVERT